MSAVQRILARIKGRPKLAEVPDPTPVSAPLYKQKSLEQIIAEAVRSENFRYMLEQEGMESIEEFEDFDVDDSNDPLDYASSPHTLVYDEDLGKEISQQEASQLQQSRAAFDKYYEKKRREKRKAAKEESAAPEPKKDDPE